MKIIKVSNCQNCPFCGYSDGFYSIGSNNFCMAEDNKDVLVDDENNLVTPDWCPLKNENIEVSFTHACTDAP